MRRETLRQIVFYFSFAQFTSDFLLHPDLIYSCIYAVSASVVLSNSTASSDLNRLRLKKWGIGSAIRRELAANIL